MWQSVNGCVIIQIKGKGAERLLNEMRLAGIPVRDLTRVDRVTVQCRLRARDFKRLHALRSRRYCSIRILSRGGVSFFFMRLFRRRVLWMGMALVSLLLCVLSTRICLIRVVGCERVAEATVLRSLASLGVTVGRAKAGLSLPVLGNQLMATDDRIGWAGLSLDGVVLTVEIVETVAVPEPIDPKTPCDVVAVKDGIVTRVVATAGLPAVQTGDAVQAGDVLIRGDLTREDSQTPLLVHAHGEVRANVYYFAEAAVLPETQALQPSGQSVPYRAAYVGDWMLFESDIPFASYRLTDVQSDTLQGAVLPLRVVTGVCEELTMQPQRLSAAEQKELAAYEAEEGAMLRVPSDASIVEKTITYTEYDGCLIAVVCVVTEETIGIQKELPDGGNE